MYLKRKIKFEKMHLDYKMGASIMQDSWNEISNSYIILSALDIIDNLCQQGLKIEYVKLGKEWVSEYFIMVKCNKNTYNIFYRKFMKQLGDYISISE